MAQIKKTDRSEKDLTPKQRLFVDILVANWGEISYAEACKQAKYECKNPTDYSAIASRLLNRRLNPHIAKYLDKKYEEEVNKFSKDKLKRFDEATTYEDWYKLYEDIFNREPMVNKTTWQQSPIELIIDAIIDNKPIKKDRLQGIDL